MARLTGYRQQRMKSSGFESKSAMSKPQFFQVALSGFTVGMCATGILYNVLTHGPLLGIVGEIGRILLACSALALSYQRTN